MDESPVFLPRNNKDKNGRLSDEEEADIPMKSAGAICPVLPPDVRP